MREAVVSNATLIAGLLAERLNCEVAWEERGGLVAFEGGEGAGFWHASTTADAVAACDPATAAEAVEGGVRRYLEDSGQGGTASWRFNMADPADLAPETGEREGRFPIGVTPRGDFLLLKVHEPEVLWQWPSYRLVSHGGWCEFQRRAGEQWLPVYPDDSGIGDTLAADMARRALAAGLVAESDSDPDF